MTRRRFRTAVAVYGVIFDGDRVLLLRRAGSGYRDGALSLPAGHLDGGEDVRTALVRELDEELGITVDVEACRLSVVAHRAAERDEDDEYVDFFFTVTSWTGAPVIGEPTKCTELVWADRQDLPINVIDYIKNALRAVDKAELLILDGWNSPRGRSPEGAGDG